MSNCLIAYPNEADKATLSGGSWYADAPLELIKTPFMSEKARSTDLQLASTQIHMVFDPSRAVSICALSKHNLSTDAKVRIRLFSNPDFTTEVHDSGWINVWPGWYDSIDLAWSDSNFWDGRIKQEEIDTLPAMFVYPVSATWDFLGSADTASAIWEFDDPVNPDGYIEIGRMFMASGWVPVHNMDYGASLGVVDPSVVDTALDGTDHIDIRPKYREANFTLAFMGDKEGTNNALILTWRVGISQDLLYVFDPEDQTMLQQRSFIGRMKQLNALSFPAFQTTSMLFNLKELV